ncbi:Ig-like domain-containing protein [Arcticibacterium luteifluviistationis]|uniref:Peptidase M12B domain-containing protein n=1 Tax=Arcticibacterium luteifluviistationis TaxID=1784714 RepID=A0A2Z4G7A1_9BACT|nr:M12 family metallo-peptidase [Arcticibacterium luteifluviistationis]AWV96960.1 hypothetical protein DJ013_01720 [Arcticibacterium luteifluviistationis]
MKILTRVLLALLVYCSTAQAQKNDNLFERRDLSSINSLELKSNLSAVPSAQLLTLNETQGIEIFNEKGNLTLQIPLQKDFIEVELSPATIFSPNFKVLSSNGNEVEVELPNFYHGKIKGESKSFVAISITKDAIEGMIVSDKVNLTIGRLTNTKEKIHVVYATNDIENKTPICAGAKEVEYDGELPPLDENQTNAAGCKAVEVYLEADYQMYTDWGGSVQTVVNTLTSIFNNVSLLYDNEGVNLVISTLFVWETPDPYTSATDTEESLNLLDAYWDSQGNNFDGDLVHLVTSKSLGGGVAYLLGGTSVFNGMTQRAVFSSCGKNSAKGMSGSITNSVTNVPTFSWNVEVIAHEIGHNFGLPHTQSCTWSDGNTMGALDNCFPVEPVKPVDEGGVLCAPGPTPTNGGTIMSYCHLSSVGINFNNGFGTLPSGKMNAELNAATCLSGSKVARPVVPNQELCSSQSVQFTATGCTGTYQWFDAPMAGNLLSSVSTYTTPTITQTASYYVSCTADGCTSRRRKVDAILYSNNAPPVQDLAVCGSNATVTLTTNCNGANIKWYSAATAGTLLGSGNNFQLTNISSSMTVYAECSLPSCGTSTRAPLNITYMPVCPYCEPTGLNCSENDMITQVKIDQGNANLYENTSTCSSGGYSLNTPSSTVELMKGNSYKIITSNPGVYEDGMAIWVDYDRDGIFQESEKIESYYTGAVWTSRETSFTIPASSSVGITRIRVKVVYGVASSLPCSSTDGQGFGEIEDYIVTISASTPCPPTLNHAVGNLASGTYSASQTITSRANVSTPTTYQAGNHILLNAGFQAGTNETFEAKIGGCP